jgi:cyclopropane fatty-acyl-phospholipid synthase-like methyltransferase
MQQTYDGFSHAVWMKGLQQMDGHNIQHLLSLFALTGIPESFLDVGCGDGIIVKTAKLLGIRAYGLDQLVDDTWGDGFYHVNLVDFWKALSPVDIVMCIEVAEHLHESAHSTLCDTIANNLKKEAGSRIIFGAARPGQDGTGHVACRPASYWHERFIERGFSYSRDETMQLGLLWSNINSPLSYFWDNLIVFKW